LRREVAVWHRLDHPNIVPLLGITYDFGSHISMVSPWLENGTLNDYLRSREPQPENLGRLLIDIVDGLAYLHSHDVIHGDLHPANVLIGDNGRAQVTDFGLSLIIPEFEGTSFMTTSVIRGALRWVAPEIFSIRPSGDTSLSVSEMSDVYSFGGIVYQVLCGEMPFADVRNDMQVIVSVKDGQRPKRHRAISTTNWVFLQWCWNSRPEDRPSLVQIREFLQTKLDEPLKGQLHPM
ncbi:kinase-like domain-containing protein, partial [Mycena sp. CBHHK59/15]